MEPLQNRKKSALIVVEGERLESEFFKWFTRAYDVGMEICLVGGNIYELYKKMKEYHFEADIKDVLLETGNHVPGTEAQLKQKFTYTYLVFDFDAHHREFNEQELDIATVVKNNINRLKELTSYFTNETDPTVGRIYINYPMMESFRDCSDFWDETFSENSVKIEELGEYKRIAGNKRLASRHLSCYARDGFSLLSKMNIYKLNMLHSACWDELTYEQYLKMSQASLILARQEEMVATKRKVYVINTSLFLMLDYFGNRDGFFDSVVRMQITSREEKSRQILQPV